MGSEDDMYKLNVINILKKTIMFFILLAFFDIGLKVRAISVHKGESVYASKNIKNSHEILENILLLYKI